MTWWVQRWHRNIFYALCGAICVFLIFPILVIVPISFSSSKGIEFPPPGFSMQWYVRYFDSSSWLNATYMSFKVALLAALFSTVLGTLAAFGLARGQYRFKPMVQAFIISPIIVPVIVLATALYRVFDDLGLIGGTVSIAIAHTIVAVPFVVVTVGASLARFDERLEQAAMGLGANQLECFFRVTLPLIQRGVLAGALFSFMASFDEVVIALFIGTSTAPTLPMKMWETLRTGIDPTISAVSVLLISLTLLVLAGAASLQRDRHAPGQGEGG